MAKLNNKGFSLVELIIAIAVFTFMIVPIISQLTVSMNISNRSRAVQEDSEYAQYIMEYFKSTPLDQIGKDNLFDGSNALQLKTAETTKNVTVNGAVVEYSEIAYEIPKANAVQIGKGKFYSAITLDTKEYALTQAGYRSATDSEIKNGSGVYSGSDGKKYVSITAKQDPNQTNVGNLTNLDSKVVAIIDGDASNCDKTASDAIFTMKSNMLKNGTAEEYMQWEQLMYGGWSGFDNDTVKKVTRISVVQGTVGSKTSYTVKAVVDYKDSNGKYVTKLPSYNVYQSTFVQDEPPVIYYMYNPCVYNAEYMAQDYIVLDTKDAGDKEIKMYLIETAAEISANIQQILDDNSIPYASTNLIEYVNTSGLRTKREEIVTYFNMYYGSTDATKVKVYTNKDLTRIDDSTVFENIKDTTSYPDNQCPRLVEERYKDADNTQHFVQPLSEDTAYEGRLYTLTVTLYDASDDSAVATFTGTRGAN